MRIPLLLLCFLGIQVVKTAALQTEVVSFEASAVSVSETGDFDDVRMKGCIPFGSPGSPALPAKPLFFALSEGDVAVSLKATPLDSIVLATSFVPRPIQPPAILPMIGARVPDPITVEPENTIYRGTQPYPRVLVRGLTSGTLRGSPVATALLAPMRWFPEERRLVLYTRFELTVSTAPSNLETRRPRTISPVGEHYTEAFFRQFGLGSPSWSPEISRDAFDYLVICAASCSTAYADLAEWKTRKGLRTVIVTKESIEATYPGPDEQARIRACVQDYYENYGIWYVLLGNDSELMLTRKVWAMDCEAGIYPDENEIRADLYFSDLDGTWDADGDGTYGETSDLVDMFPDLLVGRLPADTPSQAQDMVEKTLMYEKLEPSDYQNRALFFAEVLWSNPLTDGGIAKDMIDSLCFPSSVDPIEKQYETLGNESPASVLAALNDGRNLTNHAGHANSSSMGCGSGYIYESDMDGLNNGPRYTIMYSIGCYPAALDKDCIAEHFMQNGSGGGVAFVGNCRYGWGSPGNPGYGYSDLYDTEFWRHALVPGGSTTGLALAETKIWFIPYSQEENVYRWHQYQVNLLGEPDLPVMTDLPQVADVAHPEELSMGYNTVHVSVTIANDPFENALVCLSQPNGIYERAFSDQSGTATLVCAVASLDPVDLTITGHNLRPYLAIVPVATAGAFVDVASFTYSETTEPINGVPNPGEELYLSVDLTNSGTTQSGAVAATLRSPSSIVVIEDSTETCPSIPPGETEEMTAAFSLTVSPDCGHDDGVPLELEISYPPHTRTTVVPLVIAKPHPVGLRLLVDDENMDGYLDPGESAALHACVLNAGTDTAYALESTLQSLDSWLAVEQGAAGFGTVPPGIEVESESSFLVELDMGSASPRTALVALHLADSRWSWHDTLTLPVGALGFQDEIEFGQGGWAIPGSPANSWHISDYRSHSGSSSWYCGVEDSHHYMNGQSDTLLTPAFVADADGTLSMWLWFDVTIYGVDGLYIDVLRDQEWVRLSYIGSGGALPGLLMGHDWARYDYSLALLEPGTPSQVRFVFNSDNSETAEGFYLDDIEVSSSTRVAASPLHGSATPTDGDLLLQWDVVRTDSQGISLPRPVDFYDVYRDWRAWFSPGPDNLVAPLIADEDPETPGIQWTDTSASPGNPTASDFYVIRPVWGGEDGQSSVPVGCIDYEVDDGE